MRVLLISASVAAALFIGACATLPGIGAGALLHPAKNRNRLATPAACRDETFTGAGVMLRGWRCTTTARRRGTIVWLHGVADNHGSAAGLVDRFVPRGFDLVAYDSRAHGDSDGDVCIGRSYWSPLSRSERVRVRPPFKPCVRISRTRLTK